MNQHRSKRLFIEQTQTSDAVGKLDCIPFGLFVGRMAFGEAHTRRRGRCEPHEASQVSRDGHHEELVTGSAQAAQSHVFEAERGLQVCEEHPDLLAFVARPFELGHIRHLTRVVACVFRASSWTLLRTSRTAVFGQQRA